MECCNATLFGSKEKTTDLIRSGEYIGILQQLQPILDSWRNKFQSLDGNSPPNRKAFLTYRKYPNFLESSFRLNLNTEVCTPAGSLPIQRSRCRGLYQLTGASSCSGTIDSQWWSRLSASWSSYINVLGWLIQEERVLYQRSD